MQSMTGFGFVSASGGDFKLDISVKSVNSRFLDIKFYTPSYYAPLEPEMQKLISRECQRGAFVVRIERCPPKPPPSLHLNWNKAMARKWKKLYENLSQEMKCKNHLTVGELMNCEGVASLEEKSKNLSQLEKKTVKESFSRAFKSCLKERKREGLLLKKDILSHWLSLQSLAQKIKQLNKKRKDIYLKKRSQSKDMVLEWEKFDVHEEMVRIKEHLKHFKRLMIAPSVVGRKMDFYVQEILREINTIGSKAQQSELTLQVVEAKFALEKIKEQIQNIE